MSVEEVESAISQVKISLEKVIKLSKTEKIYKEDFLRWVSIKLIDGEKKILESIRKNTDLEIENPRILEEVKQVKEKLKEVDITQTNFKDKIISRILHHSEDICKDVCTFENENYTNQDRKIDKILTSKKWGIPIMLLFFAIIFWLTIIGSNYPSNLLFSFA